MGFCQNHARKTELINKIREIIGTRKQQEQQAHKGEQHSPLQRRLVVIGEDDADIGRVYKQAFASSGLDTHFAVTGPEVLEQAVSRQPQAIVMKELLPNMNGSVVARLIKAMPHTRQIPIVVHDESRNTRPATVSTNDVDAYVFTSKGEDLASTVRQLLS
jgi:CheY-like chemotaxis protein